jgi:hypothetical protein
MKTNSLSKTFSQFSAAYLSLFSLFALILGWFNPSLGETGVLIFAVMYCCGLIPLSLLTSTWLVWKNRTRFSNTFIWMAFQILFVVSMAMYPLHNVGLFFSSLLVLLFPLIGIVNFLYAFRKGASLGFMGWGSIGLIWSILIVWRIKGNLLEEMLSSFGGISNDLWYLYAIMYGFAWIVFAGVLAFILETFQILWKEYAGNE